jgi:peptidyl-prolyl cis-trans isomerase D
MSVIQKIQEKYAKAMAIIIALALIIFVIMLAFENGGTLFRGGSTNVVGKVNGEPINYTTFQKKVELQENNMKQQQQGYFQEGPAMTRQAIDAVWNQEVDRLLIASETGKLGIGVGQKELGDILYGANPPEFLKSRFTNEAGIYDAAGAKRAIDDVLRKGTAAQKAELNAYIGQLEQYRVFEKYSSLLTNSVNYPRWMVEKEMADNSQLSKISYVREFYSAVPDSAVKISDGEIEEYINKHKDQPQYKQLESRSISYVAFSALPTAADSNAARTKLLDLKPAFDSTPDMKQFLESQGTSGYYDGFLGGKTIQIPLKDSIFKTPVGSIYGPYIDGGSYTLAKMLAVRTQPDTVTVRHILIGLTQPDPQTGQAVQIRDTAAAYKLADSIRNAIKAGSNFDTLAIKFSDDPGKYDQQTKMYNGAKYENVTSGRMVPEFNDFIFGHATGESGIVKTDFGYHYIEILSTKGSGPAYKIAYLPVQITASQETDAHALSEATKFAGDSRDQKSFDANAEKLRSRGINKLSEANIPPNGYQLQMGISRSLVKNIYAADLGDVLQPERVGDYYVVAIVTEVNEEGTLSVAKARPLVEPLLRNRKKAEILIKKAGTPSSLEAVATAWGSKPIEVADSLRLGSDPNVAVPGPLTTEPKVIGAAFNPANKGKVSAPIEGASGVFVIRVENISATPVLNGNVEEQRQAKYLQNKFRESYPQQSLKEAATIKDDRSKFY